MDGQRLKINTVDLYADYRNTPFLNDDYGVSPSQTPYGLQGFETPALHATETRFLLESLAAPSPAYPSYEPTTNGTDIQQQLPSIPRVDSGRSSVSGSHRSSDSDVDDTDDLDVDTSKLSKEELRKHKNRQSAARSRKRNRDRMGQLEALVRQLSLKNRQLEDQVQALLLERERAAVERHHAHMAPPPPPLHTHHSMPAHLPLHTAYY